MSEGEKMLGRATDRRFTYIVFCMKQMLLNTALRISEWVQRTERINVPIQFTLYNVHNWNLIHSVC